MDNDPICRFCLSPQEIKNDPLIEPCECKGTQKYIHLKCAKKWRTTTNNPYFYSHCQLCKTPWKSTMRWPRETLIDLENSGTYFYLSKHLMLNILVHYSFFNYILFQLPQNDKNNYVIETTELYKILNSSSSCFFYAGLLSATTCIYGAYYIPHIVNIKNKKLFLYNLFDPRCAYTFYTSPFIFIFLFHLCASLALMNYYPFGVLYIVLLSQYGDLHNSILQRINNAGEIF